MAIMYKEIDEIVKNHRRIYGDSSVDIRNETLPIHQALGNMDGLSNLVRDKDGKIYFSREVITISLPKKFARTYIAHKEARCFATREDGSNKSVILRTVN